MGSYQRSKFLTRFLAAIAALFFWSSNLVFPSAVQAQINTQIPLPSAATAAVLNQLTQVAGSTVLTKVAAESVKAVPFKPVPLIVGAVVAGAAYYVISEAMKENFKEKAVDNFCKANPANPVCGKPGFYQVEINVHTSTAPGNNYFSTNCFSAPSAAFSFFTDGYNFGIKSSVGEFFILGQSGSPPITGEIYNVTVCKPEVPHTPWEQMPPAQQDEILETLTPSDVEQIIDIPPLFLTPNKTFSDGGWYIGPSGNFEFFPPSFVVPPDSPDPELDPPPPFPPNSEQNDDLDDDGERNDIDFDIDNDGDWNLTDRNDFDFTVNTENPPQPTPTPTPTPSPTSNPSCQCCPDPVTGQLPPLTHECEVEFTDQNFLAYAVNKSGSKFPFDIVGGIPYIKPPYPCPTFTFWGQSHEFCIINDILKGFKWVTWIAFSIKAVLSL